MWQIHATFRLGELRTRELDLTPSLCFALITAVFALLAKTGGL